LYTVWFVGEVDEVEDDEVVVDDVVVYLAVHVGDDVVPVGVVVDVGRDVDVVVVGYDSHDDVVVVDSMVDVVAVVVVDGDESLIEVVHFGAQPVQKTDIYCC